MPEQNVLQCYRCGKSIDEGEVYFDICITEAFCPSHEDYLEFDPQKEEYFCQECGNTIQTIFLSQKPTA